MSAYLIRITKEDGMLRISTKRKTLDGIIKVIRRRKPGKNEVKLEMMWVSGSWTNDRILSIYHGKYGDESWKFHSSSTDLRDFDNNRKYEEKIQKIQKKAMFVLET